MRIATLHPATGGGFDAAETGQVADMSECEGDIGILAGLVSGSWVATIKIEVSYDGGTTWVQIGADITAAAQQTITVPVALIRARCSAWTSGVIAVYVAGKNLTPGT